MFSGDVFAVEGVPVNATSGPGFGGISGHISGYYEEAKRIMQLCGVYNDIPLLTGANGSFLEIKDNLDAPEFDGHQSVNFIIEQALKDRNQILILLPIGKLTNIALVLKKNLPLPKTSG